MPFNPCPETFGERAERKSAETQKKREEKEKKEYDQGVKWYDRQFGIERFPGHPRMNEPAPQKILTEADYDAFMKTPEGIRQKQRDDFMTEKYWEEERVREEKRVVEEEAKKAKKAKEDAKKAMKRRRG